VCAWNVNNQRTSSQKWEDIKVKTVVIFTLVISLAITLVFMILSESSKEVIQ
jgi:hypothetical protein